MFKFKSILTKARAFLTECKEYNQPLPLKPNKQGENNGKSKLKDEEVLEIRRLYKENPVSYAALACRFRISRTTISDIISRRTWDHL